ncbi:MAG: hypothetical protein JOZ25_08830 [Actinobacteria bacterium]|nr:hypothetical protein [Actinomycetota bacterium]
MLLVALIALLTVAGRRRRLERRRAHAGELREEAQTREVRADRERRYARQLREEADGVDPDAPDDGGDPTGEEQVAAGRAPHDRGAERDA